MNRMNRWIGFLMGASALCLHASVIDYGKIQMQPFVSDASTVVFSIGSTAGNYSISNGTSPVFGGVTAPACLNDLPVGCAFGTYSFSAFFPDFSSFTENGIATVGGSTQDVVFGWVPQQWSVVSSQSSGVRQPDVQQPDVQRPDGEPAT